MNISSSKLRKALSATSVGSAIIHNSNQATSGYTMVKISLILFSLMNSFLFVYHSDLNINGTTVPAAVEMRENLPNTQCKLVSVIMLTNELRL